MSDQNAASAESAPALGAAVDQDLCLSSGKCVADAPGVFTFDEDELAEVTGDPADLGADRLIEVARGCPAAAIRVTRDGQEVSVD